MLHRILKSIIPIILLVCIAYTQNSEDTRYIGEHFVVNRTLSGLPLHWPNGEMPYNISTSVPNPFRSAVEAGFNAWHTNSELSDLIQSDYLGLTSSSQWGGPADGINNVVYITQNWTSITGASSETVALTRIRYNANTGRITDADIAINAQHHNFSSNPSPPPNRYDMHNTIAHEVGHVWGMSDLFPPGHPGHKSEMGDDSVNKIQTMYGVFPQRETIKRDLNGGDIHGIKYIYQILPVLNIDIVLVYDGSDNFNATYNALTQSKNSGRELVDKLRVGDRIGIVQFPDIEVIGVTTIENNSVRGGIQDAITSLTPGGNVTVGSGLFKAMELLTNGSSENNLTAIILFSSGEEEAPLWAVDFLDALENHNLIPVYTIGFEGSSGQTILNMISDATGGTSFQVPDSTYIPDVVGEIWTQLTDQLTLFVDGGTVEFDNQGYEILVDNDVEIFEPGIRIQGRTSKLNLCLVDPDGVEICFVDKNQLESDKVICRIDNVVTDCPPGIQGILRETYEYFQIINPKKGIWQFLVENDGMDGKQFFGYANATAKDFTMTAELNQQRYIIGDAIEILVQLMGGGHPLGFGHGRFGDPITDATVEANVNFPDGTSALITLNHQANGLYTASVSTNNLAGTYQFKVTASRGEEFIRERRLSTYVATSEDEFAIHTAVTIINHMINYISGLPVSAFRPASEGRRGSLINKLEVVLGHIHAEEYEQAIKKLEEDLLPKFGYEESSDGNIWVDDADAQAHLIAQTLRIIDILSDIIAGPAFEIRSGELSIAQSDIPARFDIFQNYPNPFNPVTTIRYQIPEDIHVTLSIYNLLGQQVRMLVNEEQTAGYYSVTWDGTNHSGTTLSSGMYFYKIQTDRYSDIRKMLLMK
jgi:hypothetical protein